MANSKQLLDLPPEIISRIFSHIPKFVLSKFKTIPEIRQLVLEQLYEIVDISTGKDWIPYNTNAFQFTFEDHASADPFVPVLRYDELVSIVKYEKLRPFKVITFHHPKYVVWSHRDIPELLEQCEINISFESSYQTTTKSEFIDILNELNELPYVFNGVEGLQHADDRSCLDFYNKISRFSFPSWTKDFAFEEYHFENLISLSNVALTYPHVQHLPRNLKYLQCVIDNISIYESLDDKKWDFPVTLETLNITFMNDEPKLKLLDLGFLIKLEKLQYFNVEKVKLPPNLRSLNTIETLNLDDVTNQCPGLEVLNCPDNKSIMGSKLPTHLKELEISAKTLSSVLKLSKLRLFVNFFKRKNANESSKLAKIPLELRKLRLFSSPKATARLNSFTFCFGKLTYLNNLALQDMDGTGFSGSLPISLTSLKLINIPGFDFQGLKKLSNLTALEISSQVPEAFDYELPYNLTELKISNASIRSIDITTSNVRLLELTRINMSLLSNSTFKLPESLAQLDFVSNSIAELDNDYQFPKKLSALKWNGNRVPGLPKLPETLKTLFLLDNELTVKELPSSLEELSYSSSKASDIKALKLDSCLKLKKLQVTVNSDDSLEKFALDELPKSITHLSLKNLNIDVVSGSFTDLEYLEEIVLTGNPKLGRHYEAAKTDQQQFLNFPSTIKYVWISTNFFEQRESFIQFEDQLKRLPNFKELIITKYNSTYVHPFFFN
ncbi:hypothetical protein G210_3950, partial [Candida maltosa Xu316]